MAHPTPDDLALIALGEDVEPESVEHVGGCRACFAEVEALQQIVAVGRALAPEDHLTAPHPRVWAQITDQLHDDRGAVPQRVADGSLDELSARRSPRPRRRGTVALAAAAALVVGLTGGYALKSLVGTPAPDTATTQLNATPRWPGANGTATVEDGSDGQRTLVVTMDLPPTTSVDGTFEVWMGDTRAEDMLPMGTMARGTTTARFPIPASVDLAAHPVVDVSLEPRDDSDPAHSDVSVLRGRLPV